jgi:uroporphyrinogen decarboxylase
VNDLFLKALRCEEVPRPPIWLMRQAGRYMPEYRKLRGENSFRTLITTPELAAAVTKLPIPLGVDAAILFSDILLLTEVFGFTIDFSDGKGIQLLEPQKEVRLNVQEKLSCVGDTIRLLKQDLKVPLIGFCGGPYTVAKYMKRITPEWLEKITTASIEYLRLQIAAGADAIQIFDSWAGYLDRPDFETLALPYLKKIVDAIKPFPTIVFCRGSCRYAQDLVSLKPQGIGFDWEKEMSVLRQEIPASIAIQGNLDPEFLKGPLPLLQEKATALLESMQGARGFIFNLGHGVDKDTPVENVRWLIEHVTSCAGVA